MRGMGVAAFYASTSTGIFYINWYILQQLVYEGSAPCRKLFAVIF